MFLSLHNQYVDVPFDLSFTMKLIFAYFCFLILPVSAHAADFHGYPCTQDCSGHKAGYEWAKKKNITKRDYCGGNSNSFIEGCYAWVEDQAGAVSSEADDFEGYPTDEDSIGATVE